MFILKPALVTQVGVGGQSVQIADTTMGDQGGFIANPLSHQDQGIPVAESLWVNLLGSAVPAAQNGTVEIVPGQAFLVPPNSNVWVTAVTSGHKFTSFFSSNYQVPYPPTTVPGQPGGPPLTGTGAFAGFIGGAPFPPLGVTGLTKTIPSYLYQEYTDDDDCQGFVDAQNQCQDDYVDTFNALSLPIYTGQNSLVENKLLDWVGAGVYGMARPALNSGRPVVMGTLNTYGCDWVFPEWGAAPPNVAVAFGLNILQFLSVGDIVITDDDLYRRILTWHLFKADGNYFSLRWMKRRVWRFLYGHNGISPDYAADPQTGAPHSALEHGTYADPDDAFIADTEQISLTIGVDQNVTIRFVLGHRTIIGGALSNVFGCNGFGPAFGTSPPWNIGLETKSWITLNDLETSYVPYPPLPYMSTFKEALDSGVLEVPFQFNFTCNIG
jgi:hypothetical protein